MALIGKSSRCRICNDLLADGADRPILGFPHFVGNRRDPLYPFTDAAVHADCLDADPRREAVLTCRDALRRTARTCHACSEEIEGATVYTGFLVGVPEHPLWKFNFLFFHPEHFEDWSARREFERLVDEFEHSHDSEGPPLRPRSL